MPGFYSTGSPMQVIWGELSPNTLLSYGLYILHYQHPKQNVSNCLLNICVYTTDCCCCCQVWPRGIFLFVAMSGWYMTHSWSTCWEYMTGVSMHSDSMLNHKWKNIPRHLYCPHQKLREYHKKMAERVAELEEEHIIRQVSPLDCNIHSCGEWDRIGKLMRPKRLKELRKVGVTRPLPEIM